MKVKQLIELLEQMNENAEVVIHRDNNNYGFGFIKRIGLGVFEVTDYGNDFFEGQGIVIDSRQARAICLFPEDYDKVLAEDAKPGSAGPN